MMKVNKRGHGPGGSAGHDAAGGMRWLLTYADMITLLLALFIFLYSVSSVSASKVQAFTAAFAEMFGVSRVPISLEKPAGSDGVIPIPGRRREPKEEGDPGHRGGVSQERQALQELRDKLVKAFPDLLATGKLAILEEQEGLMMRISETALFDLGSAAIQSQAEAVLSAIASFLSGLPNDIRVEGHTDSLPIRSGKYTSNWELSGARAASVVSYFIVKGGIAPQRLALAGYGEYRPVAADVPGKGHPANRRVEIMVIERHAPVTELAPGA